LEVTHEDGVEIALAADAASMSYSSQALVELDRSRRRYCTVKSSSEVKSSSDPPALMARP